MSQTPLEEHFLDDVAGFRRRLLDFFHHRRRDLPWRRDADPYAVWVSEIMCQQTQVDTVVPYYQRWMRRFPDITRLADAAEADVLKAWEGLGYYARARNLHHAARIVRDRLHGRLPDDTRSLRELPGIGHYTAGAIASIAFGAAEPAVDGNVRRVLARLFDQAEPSAALQRRQAAALLDPDRPGDFNQALMELGALVCTPRSPHCERCPVARFCQARRHGTQADRPGRKHRRRLPEHDVGTAVIQDAVGRLLLRRRHRHGLLGGLWEFPGDETADHESPADTARRLATTLLGHEPREIGPVGTVSHTFTHKRLHYHAVRFAAQPETGMRQDTPSTGAAGAGTSPTPDPAATPESHDSSTPPSHTQPVAWVATHELRDFALPVAQRKLAALL